MKNAWVNIVSFGCKLSELTATAETADVAETIFSQQETLSLSVLVEFVGSGAIALLPLKPRVQVEFFAKCIGLGDDLALGSVETITTPNQLRYRPTLTLATGLGKAGLLPEKVYKISALLRVGCPTYPALVTGLIDGLLIQTYNQ